MEPGSLEIRRRLPKPEDKKIPHSIAPSFSQQRHQESRRNFIKRAAVITGGSVLALFGIRKAIELLPNVPSVEPQHSGQYMNLKDDGTREISQKPVILPVTFLTNNPDDLILLRRKPREQDSNDPNVKYPPAPAEDLNKKVHYAIRTFGSAYNRSPDVQGQFEFNGALYGTWFALSDEKGNPVDEKGQPVQAPIFTNANYSSVVKK